MNARGDSPAADDVRAQVGARIRQRRDRLGLSQSALGRRLVNQKGKPVAGTHISKWERGEYLPERRQWAALAEALETTLDGIFGGLLVEAPEETLSDRVTDLEAQVAALTRLLDLDDALPGAIRAAARGRSATGSARAGDPNEERAARAARAARSARVETQRAPGKSRGKQRPKASKRRAG